MIRSLRRGGAAAGAALLAVVLTGAPARADAERDKQWYFAPMKLAKAQELGRGGAGVTVAVIDSGVDTKHQDLRGATVSGRNMALNIEDNDVDAGPHGTSMAVLIAGRGHGSGDGLLGVAPRSKVMSVTPVSDPSLLADGIRWAVDHGAKVINMSFVLEGSGEVVQKAIDDAIAADVVVVAGVGNDHEPVAEPASLDGVIGVGTVDRDNKAADFANYGKGLDLVTYGTEMPAARPHNRYALAQGTSDSTALVSGAVALMRARYPDMSAAEVAERLTGTAVDRGPKGRDDYYGYGQLDVIAALTAPRVAPSATSAAPPTQDEPVAYPPVEKDNGPPPLLFVAVGVLLLVLCLALFMIVRARRKS
ncbi:MAG TPA: S8 family serine peptidase [Actinoplanes sp.]|nr:S8 family serine peptidase [Actinoplanes sp.]